MLEVHSVTKWPGRDGLVVVLKEFPMTYICVCEDSGKITAPADSLAILGRQGEAERAILKHLGV